MKHWYNSDTAYASLPKPTSSHHPDNNVPDSNGADNSDINCLNDINFVLTTSPQTHRGFQHQFSDNQHNNESQSSDIVTEWTSLPPDIDTLTNLESDIHSTSILYSQISIPDIIGLGLDLSGGKTMMFLLSLRSNQV